jgi:hypothetical protein
MKQLEKDTRFMFTRLFKQQHALKDRLYAVLQDIEEFRNLSMDMQGEVINRIELMIELRTPEEDNPILKKDEWDYENDKVGC